MGNSRTAFYTSDLRKLLRLLVVLAVALLGIQATTQAQFTSVPNHGLPTLYNSTVAWGDYNNDGFLDVAISGNGVSAYQGTGNVTRIYRNNGDGTFTDSGALLDSVYGASLAWGDYDNDGLLDLVISGSDTGNQQVTYLYHNDGGGVFTRNTQASFMGAVLGTATWGDFNNDGLLDLAVSGYTAAGPRTKLYRNNGDGTFTEVAANLPGVNGHSKLTWADFNNDGWQDLLIVGRTTMSATDPQPIAEVFLNNGNGTFTQDTSAHLLGVWLCGTAVGDYDRDGRLDILVSGLINGQGPSQVDTTILYHNNGDGSFTAVNSGIMPTNSSTVAFGDYNADGFLDVAITGWGGGEGVYLNNGNGTFSHIGLPFEWVAGGSIAWGDMNGDGYLDLAISGQSVSTLRDSTTIYLYSGPGSSAAYTANTAPTAPTGLSAAVAGSQVDLRWALASDGGAPQKGLAYNLRVGMVTDGIGTVSPLANPVNGFRHVARLAPVIDDTAYVLKGLKPGVYHWSVQAVDNGFAGSAFATEGTFVVGAGLHAAVKVLLQGPAVTADTMLNSLRLGGQLASHFGAIPIPSRAVDSITIEIRDSLTAAASHTRRLQPAWLLTDGTIRNFADTTLSFVTFDSSAAGRYYLVVHHRNHLSIMSAAPDSIGEGFSPVAYDFTTGQGKAYGTSPMIAVGTKFAMIGGDGNADAAVDTIDRNTVWRPENGNSGYLNGDYNLDGGVDTIDRNIIWRPNNGSGTQVP